MSYKNTIRLHHQQHDKLLYIRKAVNADMISVQCFVQSTKHSI